MQNEALIKLNEWLLKERKCHVCKINYTNQTSFGKWMCREHHGPLKNGQFMCCGTKMASEFPLVSLDKVYTDDYLTPEQRGCIRADHKERGEGSYTPYCREKETNSTTMRRTRANALGCVAEAVEPKDEFYVVVTCYDKKELERILKK